MRNSAHIISISNMLPCRMQCFLRVIPSQLQQHILSQPQQVNRNTYTAKPAELTLWRGFRKHIRYSTNND